MPYYMGAAADMMSWISVVKVVKKGIMAMEIATPRKNFPGYNPDSKTDRDQPRILHRLIHSFPGLSLTRMSFDGSSQQL